MKSRWNDLLKERRLLLAAVMIIAVTFSPLGMVVVEEQSAVAPPLSEAVVFQGSLRFGAGARNWREAELLTDSARGAVLLQCRHFLANDACFTLAEAEASEGARATAWIHPEQGVLKLDVGGRSLVGYDDTVRRFSKFQVWHGKPDWMYAVAACALVVVVLLFLDRLRRRWCSRSGRNGLAK